MSAFDPKRTLAELDWTSVQLDFVSRGPNNLSWVALVHQKSDDAYDGSLDWFHPRSKGGTRRLQSLFTRASHGSLISGVFARTSGQRIRQPRHCLLRSIVIAVFF
jgi:hypothetical protein